MQVAIANKSSELLVNTVVLNHNKRDANGLSAFNVEFFRCYKCGNGITQIQGVVEGIYAGYIPSQDVPTITRCYICAKGKVETNYTFQTQSGSGTPQTKLILSTGVNIVTFHCIICRHQLLQYNHVGVVALPIYRKVNLPYPFTCFNPVCKGSYLLKDVVEPGL